MYIEIFLKPAEKALVLPIHYNYLVQSALYHSIEPELANFLHEKGYTVGKRSFRLFCFSLLQGAYQMNNKEKTITFEEKPSSQFLPLWMNFANHCLIHFLVAEKCSWAHK